jgi:rod shape-determining protein MreD
VIKLSKLSSTQRHILNGFIVVGSVVACCLLSFVRLPGIELLGIAPDWILLWVIVWSLRRSLFQSIVAGFVLGLLQDGLTSTSVSAPSHVLPFVLVSFLTVKIQKQRYFTEAFISVILIVFAMAIIAETAIAIQYFLYKIRPFAAIWLDYQRIALSSAIMTSLWAPVVYYPLNYWWEEMKKWEQFREFKSELAGRANRKLNRRLN